ncbi:hypothetical protein GIB67_038718 [Kingdonia uniflora]|uniref:SAC domain-containing protein n=1 Tax=Kingdonia uniflora TaxID=39325 RepID=A0A7J7NSK3_9MAGN|nr:hypothetical protein GIB67_038718 [Kingdonia uniflora]
MKLPGCIFRISKRDGNPIIILKLIKTRGRKPRESILCAEFANAIEFINKDLSDDSHLRFLHWDLHKHYRIKATNVLALLGGAAEYALTLMGFFYFQVTPEFITQESLNRPHLESIEDGEWFRHCDNKVENVSNSEKVHGEDIEVAGGNHSMKSSMLQKGILRTNCIDCLDHTNVAQYAYGLVALGHQLLALGFIDIPKVDLDAPLTNDLMRLYEKMGDTLAFQYGGSAAHNKIFSKRRGQWKVATQSREFFGTLQHYYSNAYMNAEKQDAINVFLGYFQPQQGKPELRQLDSDQHYNVGRHSHAEDNARSLFKRSLSDGNILCESRAPMSTTNIGRKKLDYPAMPERTDGGGSKGLSDSTPEICTFESDLSYSKYIPTMTRRQLFTKMQSNLVYFSEDISNCSNVVDLV